MSHGLLHACMHMRSSLVIMTSPSSFLGSPRDSLDFSQHCLPFQTKLLVPAYNGCAELHDDWSFMRNHSTLYEQPLRHQASVQSQWTDLRFETAVQGGFRSLFEAKFSSIRQGRSPTQKQQCKFTWHVKIWHQIAKPKLDWKSNTCSTLEGS